MFSVKPLAGRKFNRRMQAIRAALRERKRAADSLGLSPRCVQVVLAAYIASRYDRSLAVDIVKALLQKRSIQIESGE